jgi:predicted transcriptional regulator
MASRKTRGRRIWQDSPAHCDYLKTRCRGSNACARDEMSTLQEIKSAIDQLNAHDKALLAAELFAMTELDEAELEAALQRGLQDVQAGRVRAIEEVKPLIRQWTSKS